MTKVASNSIYNVYIDGTANITTITNSPAFATLGNFYQISSEVKDSIPLVVD